MICSDFKSIPSDIIGRTARYGQELYIIIARIENYRFILRNNSTGTETMAQWGSFELL